MASIDPEFLQRGVLAGLVCIFLACPYLYLRRSRSNHSLPPGPSTGLFGFANIPRPTDHPWKTYAKWKELYGDVIYVDAFRNPFLVLNSRTAARELLEARSSKYSSRPYRPMADGLMGWDWNFSSMPYGEKWRAHRKLFLKYFSSEAVDDYSEVQEKAVNALLRKLAEEPATFMKHISRMTSSTMLMIAYGYQVVSDDDPYTQVALRALTGLKQAGLFGTFLVDYIPWLRYVPRWIPGADFKRKASKWAVDIRNLRDWPFELTKSRLAEGSTKSSILAQELERLARTNDDDLDTVKGVAGIVYGAGGETTASPIQSFVLAMTLYPTIQAKAQAEIDRVIGMNRLPSLQDRDTLPYVNAIVFECLRWNPAGNFSLAHALTEADVYRGMRIPANAHLFPNVWAIFHDEENYPEPMEFKPERFIEPSPPGVNEYPVEAWGFGRRICPGRYVAERTAFLAVARILATFTISKAVDENGSIIEPIVEYTSAFVSNPKPFRCNIAPRSEAAAAVIRDTAND